MSQNLLVLKEFMLKYLGAEGARGMPLNINSFGKHNFIRYIHVYMYVYVYVCVHMLVWNEREIQRGKTLAIGNWVNGSSLYLSHSCINWKLYQVKLTKKLSQSERKLVTQVNTEISQECQKRCWTQWEHTHLGHCLGSYGRQGGLMHLSVNVNSTANSTS